MKPHRIRVQLIEADVSGRRTLDLCLISSGFRVRLRCKGCDQVLAAGSIRVPAGLGHSSAGGILSFGEDFPDGTLLMEDRLQGRG